MDIDIKKGICFKCREMRILNSKNICCFCEKEREIGTEVKTIINGNVYGAEVKSKTGSIKAGYCDNAWMNNPKGNI